jgi:hypothetical protein
MAEQIFPSVLTVLEEFGTELVRDIGKSIMDKDLMASGNLSKSVKFSIDINLPDQRYTFQLDMAPYWQAVDEGRKAGKQPPTAEIKKWLQTPNVKSKFGQENRDLSLRTLKDYQLNGLAYVIARKIGKEGTKATHFYSAVVTPERIDQLLSDIGDAGAVDILSQIS